MASRQRSKHTIRLSAKGGGIKDMENQTKILLHACCAPCAIGCIDALLGRGAASLFWYNPNIHPYKEYAYRRDALIEYARGCNLAYSQVDEYGLEKFLSCVWPEVDKRCTKCYKLRLEKVAEYAAINGYDCFTTTLLISPYQDHELIKRIAQEMAEKYGTKFLYVDFRPFFREGQNAARAKGIYMQKYCGCIFSEQERYLKKQKAVK